MSGRYCIRNHPRSVNEEIDCADATRDIEVSAVDCIANMVVGEGGGCQWNRPEVKPGLQRHIAFCKPGNNT